MALTVLSKTFPITAGKSYVGQARPGSGGGGGTSPGGDYSGNGGAAGGGSSANVSWVPPSGYFADVPMTNYPVDIRPAVYAGEGFAMRAPFLTYGGSAVLRDFSALGAQAFYSGGHETSAGQTQVGLVVLCDFSSLTWYVRNVPLNANPANTSDDEGRYPDNSYYCFHTYDGLQEFPAAWGGGPLGTLAAIGRDVYNPAGKAITLANVSYASSAGYATMATNTPGSPVPTRLRWGTNSTSMNQPTSAPDIARQGWWVVDSRGANNYSLFIHKSGLATQHKPINSNLDNGQLLYIESKGLLVALTGGYTSASPTAAYKTLWIRDTYNPHPTDSDDFYYATATGGDSLFLSDGYDNDGVNNYHGPAFGGIQWVEELQAAYGFDYDPDTSTSRIVKLSPPASGDWKTGVWTWSILPLQHWAAGDPNGRTFIEKGTGSPFSRFRWVPALHAFVYTADGDRKPQVFKP